MWKTLTELEMAQSEYCDYHKAYYGCRPSEVPSTMEAIRVANNLITADFNLKAATESGKAELIAEGWML